MPRILIPACLLFFLFPPSALLLPCASGQTTGWLWGKGSRGCPIDAYCVAADVSGNVYGAGLAEGATADSFGSSIGVPNTAGTGHSQAVWIKYSSSGIPLWADGTQHGDAWLCNITTDASGNLIIFGTFDSPTITIGGTTLTNIYGTSGESQYFLAKYNPSGILLWAINDGNCIDGYCNILASYVMNIGGVITDAAGNIYITSCFQLPSMNIGSYTLTNTDPSGTTNDIFMAKYNPSGTLQWANRAGGASDDFAFGIAVGNAGNLYVTGPFWSPSATFGSSTISDPYGGGGFYSSGRPFAYIAEFSPTGMPLWAQAAGGFNGASGIGIVSDASGNLYMTGTFVDDSISFGTTTIIRPYPSALAKASLYLIRYSPANVVTWSKTIGSPTESLWSFSVALAGCGEVWVSGKYLQNAAIDSYTLSLVPGLDPVFIAGYNLSGGVIGFSGLGSGADDQNAIACDPNGNVFICSDYWTFDSLKIGNVTLLPDTSYSTFGHDELLYVAKYANNLVIPDTSFHIFDTSVCNATNLLLSAPIACNSCLWNNTSTLPTFNAIAAGSYWVICSNTCNKLTAIDTFNVTFVTTDTSHTYIDTTICISSGSVTLIGDTGFNAYQWNTGTGSTSISVSSTGVYWVTETSWCALRTDSFDVAIYPVPKVYLGIDTSMCEGVALNLSCPEPLGCSYLWSTGSTDTSIVITAAGTYSLTVANEACSATANITIRFLAPPPPLSSGLDTVICAQQEYTISSGNSDAIWSTGQTGASITVSNSGVYVATLQNQCGISQDSISIKFLNCDLLVPNAFTPNNDGKNDIFSVVSANPTYFRDFSLSIYNRWGQRVFYTNNINDGWDGTFNGTPQNLGTYSYMVFYTINRKTNMLKGNLELIR